jgi:hypothetical protein
MPSAPPSNQASRRHGLLGNSELPSLRCEKRWRRTKRQADADRFSIWKSSPFLTVPLLWSSSMNMSVHYRPEVVGCQSRPCAASFRSAHVRNALLATVGPKTAACRDGSISAVSRCSKTVPLAGDWRVKWLDGRVQARQAHCLGLQVSCGLGDEVPACGAGRGRWATMPRAAARDGPRHEIVIHAGAVNRDHVHTCCCRSLQACRCRGRYSSPDAC